MDKNAKKLIMILGSPTEKKMGKSSDMPMDKSMMKQNASKTAKKKTSKKVKKKGR